MTTLEELGLLKMDFLGLRTLTVIQNAVNLVNNRRPDEPLDLSKVDYNDPAVMEMIGKGRCEGVFQLESAGMKSFMKQLKPHSLEDIIAGIALYRPGPMDFIPKYIRGKEHPDTVTYECEEVRPILEPTYGCIVYQEQVMQIVRDLGGYSMGRSDLVRRAMSKKKAISADTAWAGPTSCAARCPRKKRPLWRRSAATLSTEILRKMFRAASQTASPSRSPTRFSMR